MNRVDRAIGDADDAVTKVTKAAHTPGPWTSEACFRYDRASGDRVPDGFEIHDPEHEGVAGLVENEANARLIAAAPEMLEALESILPEILIEHDHGGGIFSTSQLVKAEAAIQKARGLK